MKPFKTADQDPGDGENDIWGFHLQTCRNIQHIFLKGSDLYKNKKSEIRLNECSLVPFASNIKDKFKMKPLKTASHINQAAHKEF